MFNRRTFLSLAAGGITAPRLAVRPAGVPEGRALCKRGGRSHALRRRCRGRGVDQKRDSHAACRGAICLAACIETLSLCRDQQQRFRLWQGRDRASRHRVQHRSGDWRSHARTAPRYGCRRAPSTSARTFRLRTFWWRSTIRARCASTASNKDFTPGEEVTQPGPIDAGIFAHQVRMTPDNRLAILVTRGNEGTPTKAEDPGALKVFDYKDGVLTNEVSIAPNGGKEFGPRHLDFHPTKPWMYVSIETQNKMYMYRMEDGRINPEIAYRAETLAEPNNIRARQAAGTVHVHPNGRFVYGANRAEATTEFQGKQVFKGGENSIVVYAINQSTGEPTPIQHIETQKIHPRTFHIDPSGRLLVAQHNLPVNVRDGDAVKTMPAGLSVFRIGDDGKLTFVRKYDIDVGDKTMFWMGMVPL